MTDWDRLPEERHAARMEEAEIRQIKGQTTAPAAPIDPNTASRDELMELPGVGEVTALRIIEGRPYGAVEDLLKISGIGPKTLEALREYLVFSAPVKTAEGSR